MAVANGVDVSIGDKPSWNTIDYSVEEDASPIDPTSSIGGSPSFTLSTNLLDGDKRMLNLPISITDGAQGKIHGKITGLATQTGGGELQITGTVSTSLLNVIVSAAPFSGTLAGALGYYLGLVGLTSGDYTVDASLISRAVVFPGWNDNLQDKMKELCAGQQVELAYVKDKIQLRPLRQNVAQIYRDSDAEWELGLDQQAQNVSSFYYNATTVANGRAYPITQPERGADIQQVDDGQTIVVNIDLTPDGDDGTGKGFSISTVTQPIPVDSMTEDIYAFDGSSGSSYTIIDSNNNVYPAATWTALGGLVTVSIDPDSNGLALTITGPQDNLGPYRLARTNDNNQTFYTTIRLAGAGAAYHKKLWTVPTGLTESDTSTISTTVADNFAINTIGDAMSATLSGLRNYQGPSQQITVKTNGINGASQYPTPITFALWDALYAGGTFTAWDTLWAGGTFQNHDDYLTSLVAGDFSNQAFGNVGGARVWNDDSWFRISTATITESSVTYTAVADNTIQDWDNIWGGKTFAQWDAVWAGARFIDMTPTLLATGSAPSPFVYLDPSSVQDVSNSPGLGYEHFPNLQQWTRANITPSLFGYGNSGYGVNPYGL